MTLIARRSVLQGGLAIGFYALNALAAEKKTNEPAADSKKPNAASGKRADGKPGLSPNVFVHIATDGAVTIVCHRSEMGQGIRSSLPVLIADELGADMRRVEIVQADGDEKYGDQNTDGSASVRSIYEDLRKIGATPRSMLISVAAKRWKVKPDECSAKDNRVVHAATQRSFEFGELTLDAAKLPVPKLSDVKLRPDAELVHVGTELPLLDGLKYVTGKAVFGADVSVPGMLVAVIARPKVVGGRVVRVDDSKALAVPGVKQVIQMPAPKKPWGFQPWGGVAVLAENTWAALKGRDALEITWDDGENGSHDSEQFFAALSESASKPGQVLRKIGDAEGALKSAAKIVEAEYHVPHLPHAPMEPPCALAHVTGDTCEIWTPTQNPQAARDEVVKQFGFAKEKVTIHVTFLGGGFGRKSKADFVAEAVFLSKQAKAPVRVQWTRADDLQHDYYNAVNTQRLTAGLDAAGTVTAWRHRTAYPPIATTFGGKGLPGLGDLQQGVLDLALAVPNVAAEACAAESHVRVGWLRSVYNIFHGFGVGSFVDEIAHAKGADPRQTWFEVIGPARKLGLKELGIESLRNYGAPLEQHPVDAGRLRHVIERVTASSSWDSRKKDGRALGLAAHRSFLAYTAVVASVRRGASGRVEVDEVWIAFDAGRVVNLDRVRAQLEGSVVFGISIALFGEMTMKRGATVQTNFRDLRIARIGDVPRKIHVDVVRSEAPPCGVGEPGVPPVAPAIGNAWFALTGERVRRLPLLRGKFV